MLAVHRKALARAVDLYGEWYVAEFLRETHKQFRAWFDGHEHMPDDVFLQVVDLILRKESEPLRAARPSPVDQELMSERPQR